MLAVTESEYIEDLVARAADGDPAAQSELFSRYGRLIRQVLRCRWNRMSPQVAWREETVDLEQRVALQVLRWLPKHAWQGQRAFVAWLRKLADADVIDAARYHAAQRRDARMETPLELVPADAPPGRSPETAIDYDRRLAELHVLLDRLKPEYAAAVRLNSMGFTHKEIGHILDCSAEAARKLVARGEARLLQLRAKNASGQ